MLKFWISPGCHCWHSFFSPAPYIQYIGRAVNLNGFTGHKLRVSIKRLDYSRLLGKNILFIESKVVGEPPLTFLLDQKKNWWRKTFRLKKTTEAFHHIEKAGGPWWEMVTLVVLLTLFPPQLAKKKKDTSQTSWIWRLTVTYSIANICNNTTNNTTNITVKRRSHLQAHREHHPVYIYKI